MAFGQVGGLYAARIFGGRWSAKPQATSKRCGDGEGSESRQRKREGCHQGGFCADVRYRAIGGAWGFVIWVGGDYYRRDSLACGNCRVVAARTIMFWCAGGVCRDCRLVSERLPVVGGLGCGALLMNAMTEPSTADLSFEPEVSPAGDAPVATPAPVSQKLEKAFADGPLRPKTAKLTKVSIVIPVYNEELTVQMLVELVVKATLPPGVTREIICVNDCSKDKTAEKLDQLPQLFPDTEFKIVHKPVNQGKGAALRDGFKLAGGDVVLIQDADLEYDPRDYMRLLQPIYDDKADVVFGSRFIGEPHRVLYYWHTVGNKFLTWMSNMFTNLNLTDMEVCYKVFRKSVLDQIEVKCNRFGFEPEITAKVAKMRPRLRIYEVGVAYYGRSYEEGKKITWKDGVKAILAIIRFRFSN